VNCVEIFLVMKAEKFYHTLRSPRATPDKQEKFRNIKRSDSEKGLERVARFVLWSYVVFFAAAPG
jgi:hypothetical protein